MDKKTCTKCGKPKRLKDFYYHRTRKCYMSTCKKCNSQLCIAYSTAKRAERNPSFIWKARAAGIKRDGKIRGIPVMNGLGNYLLDLWAECAGKCFYTGRELNLDGKYHTDPNAATVDRLVPALGYVAGNMVLASAIANRVKQNLSITELYALIDEMRAHRKGG